MIESGCFQAIAKATKFIDSQLYTTLGSSMANYKRSLVRRARPTEQAWYNFNWALNVTSRMTTNRVALYGQRGHNQ